MVEGVSESVQRTQQVHHGTLPSLASWVLVHCLLITVVLLVQHQPYTLGKIQNEVVRAFTFTTNIAFFTKNVMYISTQIFTLHIFNLVSLFLLSLPQKSHFLATSLKIKGKIPVNLKRRKKTLKTCQIRTYRYIEPNIIPYLVCICMEVAAHLKQSY